MKEMIVKALILTLFSTFMSIALAEDLPIDDFVRKVYIQGVPYNEASEYNSDLVPVLVDLLNDESSYEYWANAVVVLSIIGESDDLKYIIGFIERDFGDGHSEVHHKAKKSAIMTLGYFVNRMDSKNEALDYLAKGLNPRFWDERNISGLSNATPTYEDRNREFSKMALLGLALSGTIEAEQIMVAFQTSLERSKATTVNQKKFHESVNNDIKELINENRKVRAQGMRSYKDRH